MHKEGRNPTQQVWNRAWSLESSDTPNALIFRAAVEALGNLEGKRVVEIGSGRASDSILMAQHGALVYPVDFSERALRVATQVAANEKVSIHPVRGNIEKLPFPDEFADLAFSQGTIEHFPDPARMMSEQARILKPGGVLLIDSPQTFSSQALTKKLPIALGTWPFGWERNYTEGQLQQLMRDNGITPLFSYGWGWRADFKMGILSKLKSVAGIRRPPIQETGEEPIYTLGAHTPVSDEAWNKHRTWFATHLLNCVGVVGIKN